MSGPGSRRMLLQERRRPCPAAADRPAREAYCLHPVPPVDRVPEPAGEGGVVVAETGQGRYENHVVIGDESQFSVLVLHGILGSCQNWRFFCNKLRRLRPSLRFVLADLRNHGRSPHIDGDNGLFECAQDLYQLQHKFGAFDAIVGHSFGGKVALQCANGVFDDRLKEVWVLDSNPAKEGTESRDFSEVAQVISMLQKVKLPIANRRALVTTLMSMGASDSIAKWMTTNVIKGNGGYVWKFNLNAITNMIEDYDQLFVEMLQ